MLASCAKHSASELRAPLPAAGRSNVSYRLWGIGFWQPTKWFADQPRRDQFNRRVRWRPAPAVNSLVNRNGLLRLATGPWSTQRPNRPTLLENDLWMALCEGSRASSS
ncbi:MAG: hypothetical protein CMJ70_25180 [Planctomycetaceae bacterium]|nr:hypothetical protein [Planctomycetaceae bacterium]